MPGAGLTVMSAGQARSDRLALKPYWGKLTVRNFREGDGNVGIIRRPVRAITLPDLQGPRRHDAPPGIPPARPGRHGPDPRDLRPRHPPRSVESMERRK